MTRRIALSILATVWAILIVTGFSAYWTTRAVLLAGLDASLVDRAASAPEIVDASGQRFGSSNALRADDRYMVRTDVGKTITHAGARSGNASRPELLQAGFARMSDGILLRRVTMRAYTRPSDGIALTPVTMTLSAPAADFAELMDRLGLALLICGAAGGAIAAGVAWWVARVSLRPLRETAAVIGAIDERALDQRIDTRHLPVELLPVGARLNELLSRLEDAFARRKRFLADAAHELRTPVAAMITGLEVNLRRPRDASSQREAMETCLSDARMLRGLVESLLTQARAELRALDEPPETFDLGALAMRIVATLRPTAEVKSVQLLCALHQPLWIHSQPGRLRGVLLNLVSNAIEYNRAGGEVEIAAAARGADAQLCIRDTGPGIAPEHLPHLFDPFYRVDQARSAGGHLGLGLFLVKTHIDAMGGQCIVRCEPGQGTIFEINLPKVIDLRRPAAPKVTEAMAISG